MRDSVGYKLRELELKSEIKGNEQCMSEMEPKISADAERTAETTVGCDLRVKRDQCPRCWARERF